MMEETQAGQFPKSKGPKKLQERDHFAKVWVAVLHCLGTHFTKTLSNTDKNNLSSEHKDQNLQGGEGGSSAKSLRRFTQYWQSDSTIMQSLPMAGTKERAHLVASASAKRGRVVFTFLELAKTNSPFWSLATVAIEEKRSPTAASTLILKYIPGGGIQA